MKIIDFIEEEAVIDDLQSTDKESVIREMVNALKDLNKIDESELDDIMGALIKREKVGSTGIGKGVAVPHTKHKSITKITGAFARSLKGVNLMRLTVNLFTCSFCYYHHMILQTYISPPWKKFHL